MPDCNAILKQGIFDDIIVDTSRDISDNLTQWLRTSTFQEVEAKKNSGLNIGIPGIGALSGSFSEAEHTKWKQDIDEGLVRGYKESEALSIISHVVNPAIVQAWRECVSPVDGGRGLMMSWADSTDQEVVTLSVDYNPNAQSDLPPAVFPAGFTVVGGTIVGSGLADGEDIPFGGKTIIVKRALSNVRLPDPDPQHKAFEKFSRLIVTLNTTKGTEQIQADPGTNITPKNIVWEPYQWQGAISSSIDIRQGERHTFDHHDLFHIPDGYVLDTDRGGQRPTGDNNSPGEVLGWIDPVSPGFHVHFHAHPATLFRTLSGPLSCSVDGENHVNVSMTVGGAQGDHGERYTATVTVYYKRAVYVD